MIDLDCLDGINILQNGYNNTARTLASNSTSTSNSNKPLPMSEEESNLLTCMLITANVGTIFEEVSYQFEHLYTTSARS